MTDSGSDRSLSPVHIVKARTTIANPRADPYKRAFWRLALALGRLPTTKDKAYWDLPTSSRGQTS